MLQIKMDSKCSHGHHDKSLLALLCMFIVLYLGFRAAEWPIDSQINISVCLLEYVC